jgi:plasmid stabilization system protein ParE
VKRITLHPSAEDELLESERFYKERGGRDLALDFVERVQTSLRVVAANPRRFPFLAKCPNVQKCRITRFPFSIYYIERAEDIWIIALAHAKRRPGYWLDRL